MKAILVIVFVFLGAVYNGQAAEWFEFDPPENLQGGIIDMSDWLDAPAGKHGFVQIKSEQLVCEDGTPIKFWGVNICSGRPYTDHATADTWADMLARYGVNSVRFHKFTSHAMPDTLSTTLTPEKYERLDYFSARLKEKGIYYGWSPIYGHKPRPADSSKMLAYNEIANADMNSHLSYSTIGLVNFAPDLQDLHIGLITDMLEHKNPYTGLRYADDPALCFVELQNEDNIFFATTSSMLDKCPTYKKMLTDLFTEWLRGKYGSAERLRKVWGEQAFEWGKEVKQVDWSLDQGNICPVANHGIYDYEYRKAAENGETLPLFLLDMARFLYEQQVRFYKKFEKAIRATGYQGALVGSCWQAGSGVTHYYNLHADYIVGLIDRHNYFGGGTGHRLAPGPMKNGAMVSKPGSGLLSTGLQQVIDRPFSLSEWLSLIPNEWVAEGAPLIAAYGLGLQGWDASYAFASDTPRFTETLHTPGVYNVMSPMQLGLYPALARMIYRGDVRESQSVFVRHIHIPSLQQGKLGFYESVEQDWDQKSIQGVVPPQALAAGRVAVEFTDSFQPTRPTELSEYHVQEELIRSVTGQLEWHTSGQGFVSINTAGTKGVIGFAQNKNIDLGVVRFDVETPFAVVLLTSMDRMQPIESADRLLLTTVARARNTDMRFNPDKTKLLEAGHAPILMEPVKMRMHLSRNISEIYALDHAGGDRIAGLPVNGQDIVIDGESYQTLYYEILCKDD
ncbi:MAG: hypothetical protein U5R06_00245 [candidate division KSB1 bacterium]|nr:hypothetical protein [candidate division KSB1 bacterium]